ncbi:hypothetical protein GCM10011348_00550 [Marinobacterium nitratireducens]|uniref:Uncharacterized protein n=1 Tax=Marinobacterium nitratireducens TaxID=518897 RepID=A0A917Z5C0_9GAMM|nr:hypothetical protein GCM10011348_00550 [Marinobacterium nitratireducens]
MERSCPPCQRMTAKAAPHPDLISLSKMENSQLFKCRCCNSYLHLDLNGWEILSAGNYPPQTQDDSHSLRSA